jgi:hypothetical protein
MRTDFRVADLGPRPTVSQNKLLGTLLTVVVVAGCGSKPEFPGAHLAGAVTIDGQPVQDGSIVFTPTGGAHGQTVGATITAGRYDCPYVPLGDSLVQIYALRPTGKTVEVMGSMKPEMQDLVPVKDRDGIKFKVEGENLNQDFALKS